MEPLNNLLGSTVKEAAEKLALRRMAGIELRRLKEAGKTKSAGILDTIKENPILASTLIGGAGGAAFGGLSSLGRRKEERQTGHNMLTGALAGGALGLGGSLAATKLPEAMFGPDKSFNMPIKFPLNGKEVELDASQLADSTLRRNPIQRGIDSIGSGLKGYMRNHPLLTALMGVDMASSTARHAGQMGEHPHMPLHGAQSLYDTHVNGKGKDGLGSIIGKSVEEIRDNIHKVNTNTATPELSSALRSNMRGETNNPIRSIIDLIKGKKSDPTSMTGYVADAAKDVTDRFGDVSRVAGKVKEAPGFGNKVLRQMSQRFSPKTRWGLRGAAYLGLPAAQYVLDEYNSGNAGRDALESLAKQKAD